MGTLLHSSVVFFTPTAPKLLTGNGSSRNQSSCSEFSTGYPLFSRSCRPFRLPQKLSVVGPRRMSVIAAAKKKSNKERKKEDKHSFVSKPDEATGHFPESVLLRQEKVEEDGAGLPEFVDEDEEKVYEFLKLQLQDDLDEERLRHYEVVYLIHEKHAEEVGSVKEKIEAFLGEKRARIWRLTDWGMRRLAYKIQKAKNAYYVLMNLEMDAKWINDFKSLLDKDERVIRHLVMKRDEAITEECPPPPEFQSLHAGTDSEEEDEDEDDIEYDDEDYDDEDGIIIVDADSDDVEDSKLVEQLV